MNAVLLCLFTCRPAAFLAIWGGQPKTQPSFFNFKGQPALLVIVGLTAALRVLCRKCRQPFFEIGVVGLRLNDAAMSTLVIGTDQKSKAQFSKNSGIVTAIAAGQAYCNAPPLIPQGQKRKMFLTAKIFEIIL